MADAAAVAAPDWSQTPTDLLWRILRRLPIAADRIRFAAVCLAFRSAAAENRFPHSQIPWLMLSTPTPASTHRFLSLPENRFYNLHLPQLHNRRIIGSSEGYLIYVDTAAELHMFNPITGSTVDLPSITTIPDLDHISTGGYIYRFPPPYPPMSYDLEHMRDKFFTKVIIAPGARPGSFLAAAIYRAPEKIALARAGDESWTTIQMPYMGFKDIIFHKGILYAVNYLGKVVACDFSDAANPLVYPVAQGFLSPLPPLKHISKYLVVSGGELLQVWRLVRRSRGDGDEEYGFCTRLCSVSRMDVKGNEWVEVKSLGDQALFLGQNLSVSISTGDFMDLKGNCIYFTDDYNVGIGAPHRGRDLGVYNMESERIEPIWSPDACLNWPPPIWFTPTLLLEYPRAMA